MSRYDNFAIRTSASIIITRTLEHYSRTASGKSWKNVPDSTETEVIPTEHYNNYISSIGFFNNFGNGASCRAVNSYTYAGYVPIRVTTISPGREQKIVAEFRFDLQR